MLAHFVHILWYFGTHQCLYQTPVLLLLIYVHRVNSFEAKRRRACTHCGHLDIFGHLDVFVRGRSFLVYCLRRGLANCWSWRCVLRVHMHIFISVQVAGQCSFFTPSTICWNACRFEITVSCPNRLKNVIYCPLKLARQKRKCFFYLQKKNLPSGEFRILIYFRCKRVFGVQVWVFRTQIRW